MFGIPVPRYALVNREFPFQEVDYFSEDDDFVEVHGERFSKPFVEKPVDGKPVNCLCTLACRGSFSFVHSWTLFFFFLQVNRIL